jgi:hypothetical protein
VPWKSTGAAEGKAEIVEGSPGARAGSTESGECSKAAGVNRTGVEDGETVRYMWLEGNRPSGVTVPWNVRGRWGGRGRG